MVRYLVPAVFAAVENNNHYLLRYPRYIYIRNETINVVMIHTNVIVDTLLYGNVKLSDSKV